MTSRSYSSMVAEREEVLAQKRRGPALTRSQRLASGLAVCRADVACGRAVWRRGMCRSCAAANPSARARLGVKAIIPISFPADVWAPAMTRAAMDGISASELVRRAVVRALGQPTSDNCPSSGPSTRTCP
jgi:hypothetical protein